MAKKEVSKNAIAVKNRGNRLNFRKLIFALKRPLFAKVGCNAVRGREIAFSNRVTRLSWRAWQATNRLRYLRMI